MVRHRNLNCFTRGTQGGPTLDIYMLKSSGPVPENRLFDPVDHLTWSFESQKPYKPLVKVFMCVRVRDRDLTWNFDLSGERSELSWRYTSASEFPLTIFRLSPQS